MTNMASQEFMKGATRGLREEWMQGNLKEITEVNARAVSRRQNALVGKFKMAAGDMVRKTAVPVEIFRLSLHVIFL